MLQIHPRDIGMIRNDFVFGISQNKISAMCLNNKLTMTFKGDMAITNYQPVYCNQSGLTIVGGQDIKDETIANTKVYNIEFDGDIFRQKKLTNLPYSSTSPSVCIMNNKMFVCGGW